LSEQKIKELVDSITSNVCDFENEKGYKESLLREMKILVLSKKESQKFGIFKLTFEESEGFYTETLLLEKDLNEILSYYFDNKWMKVLFHPIFTYEKEIDHGKEYLYQSAPLMRAMFVDIEANIFYIEDFDGLLYCSIDKMNWFIYLVPYNKRPYYNRIDKLRKFRIPNFD